MKFINTADWDISVNGQQKRKAGEERSIKDSQQQEFLLRHPYIKPSHTFQAKENKKSVKLQESQEWSHKEKRKEASKK